MKRLIINAGSSSLRVSIFDTNGEIAAYTISRIWEWKSIVQSEHIWEKGISEYSVKNHDNALEIIFGLIFSQWIIETNDEVVWVAHRVVHGWIHFSNSIVIDKRVISKIEECQDLAPLHNPVNLECIRAAMIFFSNIPHVAVFDTAFHRTIPEVNYLYAIPKKYSEKYNIRKYGFHGSSHKYMSERVLEISERKLSKIITCHVGWGASICAVLNGESINTSMWFTPVDGLVMGTRSWEVDPSVMLYIWEKEWLSMEDMRGIISKESWMLWLTWVTWDIKEIIEGIKEWNKEYQKALDVYISRIVRCIGWYIVDLWWLDAIVFTWWVLENEPEIRRVIAEKLECFGLEFDTSKNNFKKEERKISTDNSKIELFVIPMQEEAMMNQQLEKFI